jgi:hypothetical protein
MKILQSLGHLESTQFTRNVQNNLEVKVVLRQGQEWERSETWKSDRVTSRLKAEEDATVGTHHNCSKPQLRCELVVF